MAYFRMGMRLKLSRAAARAMGRSGGKQGGARSVERMFESAKHRFGGSVRRPSMSSWMLDCSLRTSADVGCCWCMNAAMVQVGRPLAAALANAVDTGVLFHSAAFLFFNDGEDDDGT